MYISCLLIGYGACANLVYYMAEGNSNNTAPSIGTIAG